MTSPAALISPGYLTNAGDVSELLERSSSFRAFVANSEKSSLEALIQACLARIDQIDVLTDGLEQALPIEDRVEEQAVAFTALSSPLPSDAFASKRCAIPYIATSGRIKIWNGEGRPPSSLVQSSSSSLDAAEPRIHAIRAKKTSASDSLTEWKSQCQSAQCNASGFHCPRELCKALVPLRILGVLLLCNGQSLRMVSRLSGCREATLSRHVQSLGELGCRVDVDRGRFTVCSVGPFFKHNPEPLISAAFPLGRVCINDKIFRLYRHDQTD